VSIGANTPLDFFRPLDFRNDALKVLDNKFQASIFAGHFKKFLLLQHIEARVVRNAKRSAFLAVVVFDSGFTVDELHQFEVKRDGALAERKVYHPIIIVKELDGACI
jgi:hypothetical protein